LFIKQIPMPKLVVVVVVVLPKLPSSLLPWQHQAKEAGIAPLLAAAQQAEDLRVLTVDGIAAVMGEAGESEKLLRRPPGCP
jgi:hypothetical protein